MIANFFKGMFAVTSKEIGREVVLAALAVSLTVAGRHYLNKHLAKVAAQNKPAVKGYGASNG